MANNADPDQLLLQKPTDLDLHCLLRQGMSRSAREGLMSTHNMYFCGEIFIFIAAFQELCEYHI